MELEAKAKLFATNRHAEIDQRRKYTNEPYIVHPEAVVNLVKTVVHSEEMIAAAWLHDTVEDTRTTIEEIDSEFGKIVSILVNSLTDISKPEDGNRAARKAMDREHIAQISPNAKTIKLADLIDNSNSILMYDPQFAKVYMKEKALLLEVLQEGDLQLFQVAAKIVKDYNSR